MVSVCEDTDQGYGYTPRFNLKVPCFKQNKDYFCDVKRNNVFKFLMLSLVIGMMLISFKTVNTPCIHPDKEVQIELKASELRLLHHGEISQGNPVVQSVTVIHAWFTTAQKLGELMRLLDDRNHIFFSIPQPIRVLLFYTFHAFWWSVSTPLIK